MGKSQIKSQSQITKKDLDHYVKSQIQISNHICKSQITNPHHKSNRQSNVKSSQFNEKNISRQSIKNVK